MTSQTIDLRTAANGVEYTREFTFRSTEGVDITAMTFELSLGTDDVPGTWFPADITTRPTPQSAVPVLLIGSTVTPAAADYRLWVRGTGLGQVIPRSTPYTITVRR